MAVYLRNRCRPSNTRVPVGVGVAKSKTLSKLANRGAKTIPQCNGVCVLDTSHKTEWLLKHYPVTKVWGIAKRLAARLEGLGIATAWDLAKADAKAVRKHTSVCVERIIAELNGVPCYNLEEEPPSKKQIFCTRSFGHRTTELEPILEAISLYSARAAEKLRAQKYLVKTIYVFINSSPFGDNYYSNATTVRLPYPTDDTRMISHYARYAVTSLYQKGPVYVKAGVGMIELIDPQFLQYDLLEPGQSPQASKIMSVVDRINQRHGKQSVFFAAQGISTPWHMRQRYKSPEYTTRWSDIPLVLC